MGAKPAWEARRDRNLPVVDSKREAQETAAIIYMSQWFATKGAPKEKILDLLQWDDRDKELIVKTYRRIVG